MAEKETVPKKKISTDWLLRGVLTKVGDTFDRFTGRRWIPSSTLATSELIERLKTLLDAEAKDVPGKGRVVPHNIKLRMQWDKFSDDSERAIATLQTELLTAAVDHINDSLYFTYAPLVLEVKADYFTEGVKFLMSFDKFTDEDRDVEMNVTVPGINLSSATEQLKAAPDPAFETYIARFDLLGVSKKKTITAAVNGRISVGRTGENMLVIDDPSVSKMHASFVVAPDASLAIADTGSTNGTFINDERISYGKAMAVSSDDRIKFGTVEVKFEHVPQVVPPVEVEADPNILRDTVEIDGLEFTRRVSPETAAVAAPQPEIMFENTLNIATEKDPQNIESTDGEKIPTKSE